MRASSVKRHIEYSCTERKKKLKMKKGKKHPQIDETPQIEQALHDDILIFEFSSDEPIDHH